MTRNVSLHVLKEASERIRERLALTIERSPDVSDGLRLKIFETLLENAQASADLLVRLVAIRGRNGAAEDIEGDQLIHELEKRSRQR